MFEIFLKPRITTNESYGYDESSDPNSGALRAETAVQLPHARHFGLGSAVVAAICDRAGVDTAMITTDFVEAYRFLFVQSADLWLQTFFWIDSSGGTGVCIDWRACFWRRLDAESVPALRRDSIKGNTGTI